MVLTTIASALVGLFGSALPEITSFAKQRSDRKHELELIKLQSQSAHAASVVQSRRTADESLAVELRSIYIDANTGKSWRWVDAIYKLTRPGITLLIASQWALVNIAEMYALLKLNNGDWTTLTLAWSEYDQSIFTAVIMFWFGHRAMMRTHGRAVNR